jgi:DNA-binding transcriptional MerR regulator
MASKAPEAFRTISEVAGDLELPQHVLRFWETRFAQIRPMKRGGGRRYYRPEDVDLLRGIRLLLYGEGFTIRGVQRLLKENGVGFVVSVGQTGSVHTVAAAEGGTERAGASRQRVRAAQEAAGPQSAGSQAASAPRVYALSPDKRRRMQAALDDLDEAKRLLDQVR